MNRICGRNSTDVSAIHKIGHGWFDLSVEGFESFGDYADKVNHMITSCVLSSRVGTHRKFSYTGKWISFYCIQKIISTPWSPKTDSLAKKKSSPLNPSKSLKCYLVWTSVRVSILLFDIFAAAVVFPSQKTACKMNIGMYYSSIANYEDIYIYTSAHQK
jgi:hypothetical protein